MLMHLESNTEQEAISLLIADLKKAGMPYLNWKEAKERGYEVAEIT